MTGRLVIVAKPPLPGIAKTRLGAAVGLEAAARVARALLADTAAAVEGLGVRVAVATTDPTADHGVALPLWDQGGGDLGMRLERVLRRALHDAPWAAVIGADAPHLPAAAWAQLVGGAAPAIGPAEDGGFWALRLPTCPPGLLAAVPWSAADTGAATRVALARAGLTPAELPVGWDVDTVDDLRRLVAQGGAPRTVAVARSLL